MPGSRLEKFPQDHVQSTGSGQVVRQKRLGYLEGLGVVHGVEDQGCDSAIYDEWLVALALIYLYALLKSRFSVIVCLFFIFGCEQKADRCPPRCQTRVLR